MNNREVKKNGNDIRKYNLRSGRHRAIDRNNEMEEDKDDDNEVFDAIASNVADAGDDVSSLSRIDRGYIATNDENDKLCENGTIFLNFVRERLAAEKIDFETIVNMLNLISSSTVWKWCVNENDILRPDYVLRYCVFLKSVIERYVEIRRCKFSENSLRTVESDDDSIFGPCHPFPLDAWFARFFLVPMWSIVPRSYFVSDILSLLCDDSLFDVSSTLECNCSSLDATSRNLSKLFLRKIMNRDRFARSDLDTFEEAFFFFWNRGNIYMMFPLSFFISYVRMNRVFKSVTICHVLPKRYESPTDEEKFGILAYMRYCRNFTINNPCGRLDDILSATFDVTTDLHDNGDASSNKSWSLRIAEFLFQEFGFCCISDMYDDYPEFYSYVEKYTSYYLSNVLS